jgi:hypothetical protein
LSTLAQDEREHDQADDYDEQREKAFHAGGG